MRKDENGNTCPETLDEYRKMVSSIVGEDNAAVRWLDQEIAKSENGVDEVVLAHDHQMRMILMPLMAKLLDARRVREEE